MITRKTTIEHHIGDHPATGFRMTQLHDVVTEYDLDADDPDEQQWVDEVHEARVALESLDNAARERAIDWLAANDHDGNDDASAYRAAVAAATATLPDLHVTGGATGIRTSEITQPVRVDRITVSGPGSVGIDLDD